MSASDPPTDSPPVPPGLQALRDRIDAIDHRMLDLLRDRSRLVGEVAAIKRDEGLHIRDFVRERDLLADRSQRGEAAGLHSAVVESLFRVILWASRDQQAALGAELPLDLAPRTIAIIGGEGAMGSLMARTFTELGHEVLVSDLHTTLGCEEAASRADITLVSVPISATVDVIERVGPCCGPDALLMDLTSTKRAPMEAMRSVSGTRASPSGSNSQPHSRLSEPRFTHARAPGT